MKNKPVYDFKKFSSIREMMNMALTEAPDKIAYEFKGKDGNIVYITYKEFCNTVENLGAAITDLGFGSSHIACLGDNSYDWIVAYLTVLQSASVFVPLDRELPEKDIVHLICDSESEVVFYSKRFEKTLQEKQSELPFVKYFIGFDRTEDDGKFLSFGNLIKKGQTLDKTEYDSLKSDEYDMKMLCYTSGTTGMSKGVMLTEHNLVSSVYYGVQVSQIYERGLSVLPYNHTYESVCDILVTIYFHSTLCINDSLKAVLKNMQLYKPSHIYLVPAFSEIFYTNILFTIKNKGKYKQFCKLVKLSNALLKVGIDLRGVFFKQLRDAFGGNLRKIVCGGAPIRPEIGEFFGDLGIALTGGYGITECSPLVSVNDEKSNNYNTAGSRLACLDWRIDSPNEEGIGEICVKGDVVMKGYYKQPDKTAEVLRDGWFYTGDYGYITKDDQIVITGRKKNIIVLNNGKNIYPEEIENYIMRVDYITETVVKGIKNEHGQDIGLLAEIYIDKEEFRNPDNVLKDVQATLQTLPIYKNVKKIIIRKEPFEKTTSNKIKRS